MSKQRSDAEQLSLLAQAADAARLAYAPFSKIKVGAALKTVAGEVYTGTNVENSSFGLTVCAERVAVFKAVSEGVRSFDAIAVVCDGAGGCSPCGACRQVLYEFAPDITVLTRAGDRVRSTPLAQLLPDGFKL